MEIQGLSDAQNIHSQHGALHGNTSPPLRPATAATPRFISTGTDANRQPELTEAQRDNNNNTRPGTSPFRLLAENGSFANVSKPQPANRASIPRHYQSIKGLHNVNTGEESEARAPVGSRGSVTSTRRYDVDSAEAAMQMALPLFEGEEEPQQPRQLTLPPPALRQQQREDGAYRQQQQEQQQQRPLGSRAAAPESFCGANRADRPNQELYVVFNVVQDDGEGEERQHGADLSRGDGGEVRSRRQEGSTARPCGSMEVDNNNLLCEPNDNLNCSDGHKKTVFNVLNGTGVAVGSRQTESHRTVEDVVLTNKYGDRICGQICTENDGGSKLVQCRENGALIPGGSGIAEAMDTSDLISDSSELQEDAGDPATASTSLAASETFSGTIMINNQSIIVTIENGILTLAAPPEGHVHKEDDMVSLKEHLGMKDHEDIVLLNYESGTKSIGKISTLAVSSTGQQEEPRAGVSVSCSELALVDDCSLSELGSSLDLCAIVKQEAGVLCAVTEADLVTPAPRLTVASCDGEDVQSVPPIRCKKETVSSFCCPEPDCSSTFDTRQKLKVHLLNHAEDPRPHQCTVEGCGWAFATSYKLKRHLQSHDKQRPHTCQFEGCGRRFTTVYNLKAHVKVHEHDNAFICEICSERFRSAARLANHQRVHFEPQRPHKCEFPGNELHFTIPTSPF